MVTLSSKIREQLISSFAAELSEHVQTMTDGLLVLEQNQVTGAARQETLANIFRAAHSLKGAARALGVTAVEQLAHALENLLDLMQQDAIVFTSALFTVCYRALDTIQLVQAVYNSGGTTPPIQVLQTLTELEAFRTRVLDTKSVSESLPASPTGSQAGMMGRGVAARPTPTLRRPVAQKPAGVLESPPSVASEADTAPHRGPSAITPVPSPAERASVLTKMPAMSRSETPPLNEAPPVAVTVSAPVERVVPVALESIPLARHNENVALLHDETVRVSVSKLDALMAQLSELLITKIRAEQRLGQVLQARDFMGEWQKEWRLVHQTYNRLIRKTRAWTKTPELKQDVNYLLDYISGNQEQLRQLHMLINTLARDYANDTMHTALVIDALEQEVKQVRMLPLSTITATFGRMVRDLARNMGKEAVLHSVGGEVELDKRVLEQIKDPLIHLLRNAVDHGLETPDEREAQGKPRVGKITLLAEQLGQEVVVRVQDDGRGLDIDSIRRAAVRKEESDGKQSGVAEAMDAAALVELIFKPRFSTNSIITDVSGRGVGLDVVRRNVVALRGRIDVEWHPQQGATFALILPMTLTSTRGLLLHAGGQQFAIAFSAIERILRVRPDAVTALGGHETLQHQGRPYPLVYLSDILDLSRVVTSEHAEDHGYLLVVIVATAERRMAFVVDSLDGEQEMVIKGLGPHLRHVGGIAGASVLGDGTPLLVLDVADLIKLVVRGEQRAPYIPVLPRSSAAHDAAPPQRILVVDDSVTTRTLEKNVLESAGYTVQLAVNGQQALGLIAAGDLPDLIISDVVMPRLDGFGLTQQVKGDARTANIPVILVTSLDSAQDKTRGIEVGADAYIIKQHFDQNNLLETIEQLI